MARDRLTRLDGADRILSRAECEALASRIFAFARGGGETRVKIFSWWQGELRWARNRVSLASDRRDIGLAIQRGNRFTNNPILAFSNQLDDESLEAAVREAERLRELEDESAPPTFAPVLPPFELPRTAVWSDATFGATTEARGETVRALVAPAESQGMLSAGYVEVRAMARAELSSAIASGVSARPEVPYQAWTQAQCSMTVRDPAGTGSGWAGLSSYDWSTIDAPALAARALDKCVRSRNPVRLEPGRYTVILEPQAVAQLVIAFTGALDRPVTESGGRPFTLAYDDALELYRTKLGTRVVDERVTISHDYTDPELGIVPDGGYALDPVAWIRNGVLENMFYDRAYAIAALDAPYGVRPPVGFRMSGGDTTVDEMIRTTKRGLVVTRFSNIKLLDAQSLLLTGLTRDGLWLVENGQITKAVKNFRFTESPLFVLNSIEQMGVPVRAYRATEVSAGGAALTPAIVPPLKARDFSFTSLVDAV